jgi:SPP1 gp7 family putative phage head morphogenesis protein
LFRNIGVFAAFKNHAATHEIIGYLTKSDGTLRSFAEFKKLAMTKVGNYNTSWLQAEYQTAVASTRMAEKWRNFERRADVYPNLKYVTQHDPRVRPEHQMLDGIIQPINSEFWKKFYPPNGWRCRCDVIQTDANPTDPDTKQYMPDKPFQNNVGIDKAVFPSTHPYFQELEDAAQAIQVQAEKELADFTRKEVVNWGKDNLVNRAFDVKGLEKQLQLSMTDLKDATFKPHKNRPLRNELFYILPYVIQDMTYFAESTEGGKKLFHYTFDLQDAEKQYIVLYGTNNRLGLEAIEDKNRLEDATK